MRRFILLIIVFAGLTFLGGCNEPELQRYKDNRYLFSFVPPRGWKVTAETTPDCLTSVTVQNGDCSFYICVSRRPEDFLPTSSDFANCELVKAYVVEKLRGYHVSCKPTRLQGRPAYDAIYLRHVADGAGGVRLQLVRQTFVSRGQFLYTMTSYVFGKTSEELMAAASPCDGDITRSEGTFFLHQPGQ